jgi:hypothetical protein
MRGFGFQIDTLSWKPFEDEVASRMTLLKLPVLSIFSSLNFPLPNAQFVVFLVFCAP